MSMHRYIIGSGGSLTFVDKDGRKWNVSDILDCEFIETSGIQLVDSMFRRDCSVYVRTEAPIFEMKITFSKLVIDEPEKKPQEIKSIPELIRVIR